jgi:DNA polymerase III delta prime subunit
VNGHSVEPGDLICLICGGEVLADGGTKIPKPAGGDPEPIQADAIPEFGEFRSVRQAGPGAPSGPWDVYDAERKTDGRPARIIHYRKGCEPDPAVHEALRRLQTNHVPELLATGRAAGRAYEVVEPIAGGSLAEAGWLESERLRVAVDQLARALSSFAEIGLRHRDLRPATVLMRDPHALDLVVSGFGSARLSDFDLELVAPLELTRYSAPEAIVGVVSAASDWWSLGMIVLEQATRGACFTGTDDLAFRLHVVTRGIAIPDSVDPDIRLLLQGLLVRDPNSRWAANQVAAWLAGTPPAPPLREPAATSVNAGPALKLAGRSFTDPQSFALAASEARHWEEATTLTTSGATATWLAARQADASILAQVRSVSTAEGLEPDLRHALAMMAINPALPFSIRGEIVTPTWLLAHSEHGYALVTGEATRLLERMGREVWLQRLRARAVVVRERAQRLEIELDEDRARVTLLATSRANLEAEWAARRALFPDTDHPGLSSLVERSRLADEEVILLVSASVHQFVPIQSLVEAAREAARLAGVHADESELRKALSGSRRDLFAAVDERVANFARCGNESIDDWADAYRVERRMPLPRAAVLLSVTADKWRAPPRQQYIANLMDTFEKRLSSVVGRGPLVRFVLGKTVPRLDLMELGSASRPAEALLNHVLSRFEATTPIDPNALSADQGVGRRLRYLVNHARAFLHDTGIDGRYVGFPILHLRDGRPGRASTKPRIAPVLLWPVSVDLPSGAGQTATLIFDRDREEVRLNPALEGLLGREAFSEWRSAADDVLKIPAIKLSGVMDGFGHLAEPRGRRLVPLPGKDAIPKALMELLPSAVLFNAEFTGQSLVEDLRQMRGQPVAGTALDSALRVSAVPAAIAVGVDGSVPERDRFGIAEGDPSQDAAVLASRNAPGLLVEGPPGTGKSQTIVNILADVIGRGETALVVCQKQAALRVVQKRMDAEGLGERLFVVNDVNRDREGILRALQDQVTALGSGDQQGLAALRKQRDERAARIEWIEDDLNRGHVALHAADDLTGLSYRELLGQLLSVEDEGLAIEAPVLRRDLASSGSDVVARLEEACGPVAALWLESGFEQSALDALKPFATDHMTIEAFRADLAAFSAAESSRDRVFASLPPSFEIDDPEPHRSWLASHAKRLEALDDNAWDWLQACFRFFKPSGDGETLGRRLVRDLVVLEGELQRAGRSEPEGELFNLVAALPDAELTARLSDARVATAQASFWGRFGPRRRKGRKACQTFLAGLGQPVDEPGMMAFASALARESVVRPLRGRFVAISSTLGMPPASAPAPLQDLQADALALLAPLRAAEEGAMAVLACPRPDDAEAVVAATSRTALESLVIRYQAAFDRHAARERSLAALKALGSWFDGSWVTRCADSIAHGASTADILATLTAALPTLVAFQRFRSRSATLDKGALSAFAVLRPHERELRHWPDSAIEGVVRATIRREALLGWKARIETARPELSADLVEIDRKVATLASLDDEMRGLNRQVLAHGIDPAVIGRKDDWNAITRLRGAGALSLRQMFDRGAPLGLMRLRPVWLMGPDIASRLLPLKPGLFDLVIFDEASQMPVEHSAPALFRGKRTVVAGDEKQMPPTIFFSGRVVEEDEEPDEQPQDAATEAERAALEDAWNRIDVTNCPDLLQLARGCLPATTLQIHYRSKYRELIGFSNGAFYRNRLSVPARHPDDEIRRCKPIDLLRVNGIYEAQTNALEADKLIDLLAEAWSVPADRRPSIGVVTFNRKQADLVSDRLEERAGTDPAFLAALKSERERTQGGEDMGFFVKNVENVQGDERDWIVFSTTFGRDPHGAFRRFFGVLGQAGGERRLNVAVTRAREKVVLVTSMPYAEISDWHKAGGMPQRPRDFLQAYVDYAEKLASGDVAAARSLQARLAPGHKTKASGAQLDGLAQAVGRYIESLGYDPVPSSDRLDVFGLDFAIVDPRTGLFGLGIECDAPRHDLLRRAKAREVWRPKVLKRAVPRTHRVSSSAWYGRGDEERARLRNALAAAIGREAAE